MAFDLTRINDLLMLVRDDLATTGRGVAWCRYEPADKDRKKPEYVCVDHKGRKDFLHSLSRNWREVTWVAAASYLTRAQAKARFGKYSGDEYSKAEYKVDKDLQEIGGADNRERAKFWEIWHKGMNKVVWVARGLRGRARRGRARRAGAAQRLLPVPEAGVLGDAARLADPGAGRAAIQGSARRGQHADRAVARAGAVSGGQGLLSGRQCRDQRGGAGGGQDEIAGPRAGADQQLGGVRRQSRRLSSGCRST